MDISTCIIYSIPLSIIYSAYFQPKSSPIFMFMSRLYFLKNVSKFAFIISTILHRHISIFSFPFFPVSKPNTQL